MEKKRKLLISLSVAIFLLILAWFFIFLTERKGKSPELTPKEELTKEEILEKLSAPGETEMSEKEKEEILKNLSAPKKEILSDKKKEEILKLLSAPEVGEPK